MSIRALAPWLVIVAMCLACSAGSNQLTSENYAAVSGGMSKAEVQKLLGEPYLAQKSGGETIWYYRSGNDTAAITFRGDGVIHKGETGLNVGDAEYLNRSGGIDRQATP